MTNKVDPIEKPVVPEKKGVQQTSAENALHENTIQPPEYTAPSIRWDAKQVLSRPSEGSLGVYNSVQRTPLTPAATIPSAATTHHIAAQGVQGQGHRLPHLPQVERSFGQDLSHLRAYTDSTAKDSCRSIGARAYATGHKIAFSESNPSLHTVSHEAAHAALQSSDATRTLKDGIGQTGDKFERHADAVAERVVQGQSLGSLLTQFSSGGETQSQATQKLIDDTDNQPVQKSTDSRTSSGKPIVQMMNERFPDPPAIGGAGDATLYDGNAVPTLTPDVAGGTGACTFAQIVTAGEHYNGPAKSQPQDLNGMPHYKNLGLLQDPSMKNGQALTRMHALNHHLNPDALNVQPNMFLGTAKSNGNHAGLVEYPIKRFVSRLRQRKEEDNVDWGTYGWVDYSVTPDYRTLPGYIDSNIDSVREAFRSSIAEEKRIEPDSDFKSGDSGGGLKRKRMTATTKPRKKRKIEEDPRLAEKEQELDGFRQWAQHACPISFRAQVTYHTFNDQGVHQQHTDLAYVDENDDTSKYSADAINYEPGIMARVMASRGNAAELADYGFDPSIEGPTTSDILQRLIKKRMFALVKRIDKDRTNDDDYEKMAKFLIKEFSLFYTNTRIKVLAGNLVEGRKYYEIFDQI